MIKIDVHEHADFKELVISSDKMRDIVSIYVREKSVAVVKERNGEMLRAQTFGAGCLQIALEWMQRAEPETAKEINERMTR